MMTFIPGKRYCIHPYYYTCIKQDRLFTTLMLTINDIENSNSEDYSDCDFNIDDIGQVAVLYSPEDAKEYIFTFTSNLEEFIFEQEREA